MRRASLVCTCSLLLSVFVVLAFSGSGLAQVNTTGQWSTLPNTMPINPVHVALLHNGKVLVVSGSGNDPSVTTFSAGVWDPQAGTFSQQTVAWDMFCNGMVVLPDGRAFVNGGTLQYDPFHGQQISSIYDPATNSFTNVQNMAHGRWYPTVTTLGDGRVMTFSGLDENGSTNSTVEFYTVGSGWSSAFAAGWTPPLYPRLSLLPSGKVFYSGDSTQSRLFDPSTHTWTNVAASNFGTRTYGSSVLLKLSPSTNYAPHVMIMGGGSPSTNSSEIIDLSSASPAWSSGPPMSQPRIEMNAVILPNGQVLALGGSLNDEDTGTASLKADLYDPATNGFHSAGTEAYARLYHSVALLLPDATVWVAGGNPQRGTYEQHMEIYKPPYLFNSAGSAATRPTITSSPANVVYGNTFNVQTPDAPNISSVVLVRAAASTHAFNMDQRLVEMNFTLADTTDLTVTAPPNGNIAPPGYYLLFLLNSAGVPSVSSFVQVVQVAPAATPTFSPAPGTYATAQSVTISDATAGAIIYYTTDGLQPVPGNADTQATAAGGTATVAVNATMTLKAFARATGFQDSTTATGAYTIGTNIPITFAQVAAATPQSPTATVPVSFPGAQTTGDLNIVVVGWNDTTSRVSTVRDTTGNAYQLAVGPTLGTGLAQSIYYAGNIAGGSNTVTVTFNQAAAAPDIRILEYKGVNTLDVIAAAAGSGTTANSGSATTTAANELIFGADTISTGTVAAGSNFTARIVTVPDSDLAEDRIVSATGSYNATATLTSGAWVMQMATFKSGLSNPAPTVSLIAPTSGPAGGGTSVTLTGTGFVAGATVSLGGTAAASVVVVNSTTITATTPAHAAGAVSVVVTNSDGQSGTLTNGYTYNAAPTVTSIAPTGGSINGGTSVTLTGTGFVAGAAVSIGGAAASGVVVVNSTTITATTAAHAAGTVNVVVTNSDGQSGTLTNGYTYRPAPTVGSISPTSGTTAGGTSVTITGSGFVSGATVSLGGTGASSPVVVNSTTITATTGAHSAGAADVVVTNADSQSGTLAGAYTYTSPNPAPTVGSISPNSGATAGGTSVTVTGTGFLSGATVSIGGAGASSVVVVSSSKITAVAAAHAAGTVNVVVTNSDGQSGTLTNGYTYVAAPTVTSIAPTGGVIGGGTSVTITGTGFLSGAGVSFGGTAATNVVVVNSTTITASTPAHAAGAVNVVVTNSDGQSGTLTNGYSYNAAPTVTSIAPTSGSAAGGTSVTITGTGFLAGATVSLGGSAATSVVVVNSTTMTATTAAHAAGTVNVGVTNSDGQSGTLTNGYTYNPAPSVGSIAPTSGPAAGGTSVTITGTGFVSGATVKFGATAATGVVVVNSTTITATTPAHAAGVVSVVVTNSDAQGGTLSNGYTYNAAPTVTAIAPTSGVVGGGTSVTITGTGLVSGATVSIGGTPATGVVVVNSTSITATTAAHAAGTVNVVVTNPDGQSGTLSNGFTYGTVAISFAQVAAATPQSATASVSVTFPGAQTAGDLNIVVVGWNDTTARVSTVTDSAGNTYNLAIGPTLGTGVAQSIYYASNIKAGPNTVTVKFNQAAAFPDIRILEYKGVSTLDAKAGAIGTGNSANSGSATTATANELIFGAATVVGSTKSAGTGFTARIITSPDGDIAEDRIVTATGSYSATATLTGSKAWVMQMVTFKP